MRKRAMINIDILILGGGVSGNLMTQRLKLSHSSPSYLVIDKGEKSVHPFHLHKPISEISALSELKSEWLETNVYDGYKLKPKSNLLDCNNYSSKIYGELQVTNLLMQDSIKIYPVKKEIIENLSLDVHNDIIYEIDIKSYMAKGQKEIYYYKYLINTVSLPMFLKICNIKHKFDFKIYPYMVAKVKMNKTNMYQMIYNSHSNYKIRRTTLLDDELYIESNSNVLNDCDKSFLKMMYFIDPAVRIDFQHLSPGKFRYLDNKKRKALFYYLTAKYDIFCLGRYGAWTHKVTNDVWDDTKQISDWIYAKEQVDQYEKGRKND